MVALELDPRLLGTFDELAEQLRGALEELDRERAHLDEVANDLRRKLALVQEARRTLSDTHGTNGKGPIHSKREAVLALLGEDPEREFRLAEVRAELVARGWLSDNSKAAHALQMMLTTLHKEGRVARPRFGFYKLASPEEAERTGADTGVHSW